MPSAVFPRPSVATPKTVSGISVPTGRRTITGSGKIQTRTSTTAGRTWTETYPLLFAGNVDVENFISWIRWAWNTGQEFTIKHLMTPGSGLAPNGTGSAGVTIDGASESGSSIATTGWPLSTSNVVRAGDLISIAGLTRTFEITDDANSDGAGDATININPSIYVGEEPANGAAVTTSSVNISAVIIEANIPEITNAFYYDDLSVTFRESP